MLIRIQKYLTAVLLLLTLSTSNLLYANEVSIEKAVFRFNGSSWNVDVTLKHEDTGWKHYADAWRVVDASGKELAKRTLYHPHVNEQPFTRSLSKVNIPNGSKIVFIEAHDTLHKWSSMKLEIDLVSNKSSKVIIIH